MINLSPNWYFTFHEWISSNYTLDHQSLQCLNQYLILLIELQRKKYEFTTKYYNLIQEHLRIERYIKEELKENGLKRNDEYFGNTSDDGEIIEFDDDGEGDFNDTFKNNMKRSTLTSLYSRDSTISTRSSLSIFSINYSSRLQFYPKRTFDYLNDYEDNLYKLILKKQLEIIYQVGDVNKNIESLKILLLKHDPFTKQDASLFLIIIYSTFQLLEKLKKFDITINIENWELIIDLIYNLEIFMKRIKHITLNLANHLLED
ncbi:3175_t:CDS:2 [Rhizophagus irregularis]|nr:3175_t:CDS:2 [Rhizophagus irregularis]